MGNSPLRLVRRRKKVRVLMIGLDNAGKTTIVHTLKGEQDYESLPTVGFNVEQIKFKNISLNMWDVGGQDKIRPLWRHYFVGTDALIFVVDASDSGRMNDAKAEFHRVADDAEIKEASVLVLANKSDLSQALTTAEVVQMLELDPIAQDGRPVHVQATCGRTGEGIEEGIDWLSQQLKKRKRSKKSNEILN